MTDVLRGRFEDTVREDTERTREMERALFPARFLQLRAWWRDERNEFGRKRQGRRQALFRPDRADRADDQ